MASKRPAGGGGSGANKRSKLDPTTSCTGVQIIIHAGVGGFLAGEPTKPYAEGSATAKRKHLISPRLNLEFSDGVTTAIDGPITKIPEKGGKGGRLRMSNATRSSPNGVGAVLAYLKATHRGGELILCASAPGCENIIDAVHGRWQEFKTRASSSLLSPPPASAKKKLKEAVAAAARLYEEAAPVLAAIKGYVFLFPARMSPAHNARAVRRPAVPPTWAGASSSGTSSSRRSVSPTQNRPRRVAPCYALRAPFCPGRQ